MTVSKTRNWTTIVYPESAPSNWLEILEEQKIQAFVSPLHDKDVEATGEVKKAHYHVVIMYSGPKTRKLANVDVELIGGVGCEPVKDLRSMTRYLCHLDSANKFQYNSEDVKQFGGADYLSIVSLATDKYIAIGEMIDYIEENNIIMYNQLMKYARNERFDWFRVLCDSGTMVIKEYVKSKQYEQRMELEREIKREYENYNEEYEKRKSEIDTVKK